MGDAVIWDHKKVLVTGGSSFIGSHLVDQLFARGTSPANRAANNALAKHLLGREPKTPFREGFGKMMDCYAATHHKQGVGGVLEKMLTAK